MRRSWTDDFPSVFTSPGQSWNVINLHIFSLVKIIYSTTQLNQLEYSNEVITLIYVLTTRNKYSILKLFSFLRGENDLKDFLLIFQFAWFVSHFLKEIKVESNKEQFSRTSFVTNHCIHNKKIRLNVRAGNSLKLFWSN